MKKPKTFSEELKKVLNSMVVGDIFYINSAHQKIMNLFEEFRDREDVNFKGTPTSQSTIKVKIKSNKKGKPGKLNLLNEY